ncbi:MAG: hypothetical protein L0G87_01445 [Renibacterium salmoninarum]|nr:hypothetical protein [Renibacterium salmoninarum]
MNVSAWSINWDRQRQVSQLNLSIIDESAVQAPWLLEDPLGVGGAELQVIYDVGGAGSVNLGWYRITQSEPDDKWRAYLIDEKGRLNPNSPVPPDKRLVQVTGGTQIQITAQDRGRNAQNYRLIAPESPPGVAPTIVSEIRRLMDGIAPVVVTTGVIDRAVNKTLVYQDDRLNAVQDLAKRISCDVRFYGDGQCEIYPISAQPPVWVVAGGPEGALVSINRNQSLDGLYNIFVVDGTATVSGQATPVRGITQITSGPLSVTGPHGRVPKFYSSPMISTQSEADAYARTMMNTQIAGLTTDLKIECLPNPAIQQGDWVTVASPVVNNQEVSLIGSVKTMDLRSSGSAVGSMMLTVECSYNDVQTVIGGVSRG